MQGEGEGDIHPMNGLDQPVPNVVATSAGAAGAASKPAVKGLKSILRTPAADAGAERASPGTPSPFWANSIPAPPVVSRPAGPGIDDTVEGTRYYKKKAARFEDEVEALRVEAAEAVARAEMVRVLRARVERLERFRVGALRRLSELDERLDEMHALLGSRDKARPPLGPWRDAGGGSARAAEFAQCRAHHLAVNVQGVKRSRSEEGPEDAEPGDEVVFVSEILANNN